MADAEGSASRHATSLLLAGIATGILVAVGLVWATVSATASREPVAGGPPHLVEQATAAGIDHVYDGEFDFLTGGGVAVFDCDDDHRPDIYLAGGVNPAALYRNVSAVGGELRFEEVPAPATDLTNVVGAYPIDIDGDGHVDLAVLRVGENVILRGLGRCRFERANEALGFEGGSDWTTAFEHDMGRRQWASDARLRQLPRAGRRRKADRRLRKQRPVPPRRWGLLPGDPARAGLVHTLDPVQRLGSLGTARPAGGQRPPLLPRW